MVLLALEDDAVLPDSDDARHHADLLVPALEHGALLDMHLDEALVAAFFEGQTRTASQPRVLQSLAQRLAAVAVREAVDLRLVQQADERSRPDEGAVVAFLVGERDRVHWQPGAGQRHGSGDPERAVQPACLVLALDVAARQQLRAWPRVAAQHVADAVHLGLEASFLHARHQPAPGLHVLRRVGRAVHARLERPDPAQRVEVGEEALGIWLKCCHLKCCHRAADWPRETRTARLRTRDRPGQPPTHAGSAAGFCEDPVTSLKSCACDPRPTVVNPLLDERGM